VRFAAGLEYIGAAPPVQWCGSAPSSTRIASQGLQLYGSDFLYVVIAGAAAMPAE